jgi:hypothetical protein
MAGDKVSFERARVVIWELSPALTVSSTVWQLGFKNSSSPWLPGLTALLESQHVPACALVGALLRVVRSAVDSSDALLADAKSPLLDELKQTKWWPWLFNLLATSAASSKPCCQSHGASAVQLVARLTLGQAGSGLATAPVHAFCSAASKGRVAGADLLRRAFDFLRSSAVDAKTGAGLLQDLSGCPDLRAAVLPCLQHVLSSSAPEPSLSASLIAVCGTFLVGDCFLRDRVLSLPV